MLNTHLHFSSASIPWLIRGQEVLIVYVAYKTEQKQFKLDLEGALTCLICYCCLMNVDIMPTKIYSYLKSSKLSV